MPSVGFLKGDITLRNEVNIICCKDLWPLKLLQERNINNIVWNVLKFHVMSVLLSVCVFNVNLGESRIF